jgi:RNA polymerase sigma factor (sigma-70 family)
MTDASSDGELVIAYAKDGSEAAFRALVARHVDLVYATALRQVGETGVAEEISQNVFLVLARKAPRLGGTQTLAGWLHRTTILEAKARIRAELRRKRRDHAAAEMAAVEREGAPALEALAPLLDEGLLNLRDRDRLALVLRFLEERSLREVGVVLGVDEDAARKRVSRALDRLTEFFKARGFVIGGGAAAILTGTVKAAAPATLAFSAGNAGLAAGGAASGMKLLALHFMSLTKTQITLVCALVATTPLALQWRAQGRIVREESALALQLSAANRAVTDLEREVRQMQQTSLRTQNETFNLQTRLTALNAQRTGRSPRPVYRWDDNSPLLRVPKQFLEMLPVSAVANRRGQLTDQIKEVLQLTETEAEQAQAALNQFLEEYYAAQAARMRVVAPNAEERGGRAPDEILAFELTAIGPQLGELRQELFSELQTTLGADRFRLFSKALEDWMPVNDEYSGFNSGMGVFNYDRRECFYRPEPGSRSITWSFSSKQGQTTMQVPLEVGHIPDLYQSYLQDWIARARSEPAKPEKSNP